MVSACLVSAPNEETAKIIGRNTHIWFVLQPLDVVVGVFGGEIFGLNPDEKTTALFLQRVRLFFIPSHNPNIANTYFRKCLLIFLLHWTVACLCDTESGLFLQALEVDAFKLEKEVEEVEGAKAASQPPRAESEIQSFNKGDRKGGFNKSDRNLAKKQTERRRMATAHWELGEDGDPITPPGFSVERGVNLQTLLGRLDGKKWWLHEQGGHVLGECADAEAGDMVVVVGDQVGFTSEEERLLEQWRGVKRVRLGSTVSRPQILMGCPLLAFARACTFLKRTPTKFLPSL